MSSQRVRVGVGACARILLNVIVIAIVVVIEMIESYAAMPNALLSGISNRRKPRFT